MFFIKWIISEGQSAAQMPQIRKHFRELESPFKVISFILSNKKEQPDEWDG